MIALIFAGVWWAVAAAIVLLLLGIRHGIKRAENLVSDWLNDIIYE